ncbi:hypothetical protein JAAARDRAFT_30174 [Jaapia argillacea MUCL 33604]|uniref:C2H2-type domain-containing protein n=1 Tax=Jaapia argillacea MUCL 33604 TaxID=933084 RepID=A0A067Q5E7_9AGAM|nr:hypothetical protein JAAARDRAFT_30174 [Jaapia argillacea MUCL 33604]
MKEQSKRCPDCDFATSDPGSLTRHRKRSHGYEPKAKAKSRGKKTSSVQSPSSSSPSSSSLSSPTRTPSFSPSSSGSTYPSDLVDLTADFGYGSSNTLRDAFALVETQFSTSNPSLAAPNKPAPEYSAFEHADGLKWDLGMVEGIQASIPTSLSTTVPTNGYFSSGYHRNGFHGSSIPPHPYFKHQAQYELYLPQTFTAPPPPAPQFEFDFGLTSFDNSQTLPELDLSYDFNADPSAEWSFDDGLTGGWSEGAEVLSMAPCSSSPACSSPASSYSPPTSFDLSRMQVGFDMGLHNATSDLQGLAGMQRCAI